MNKKPREIKQTEEFLEEKSKDILTRRINLENIILKLEDIHEKDEAVLEQIRLLRIEVGILQDKSVDDSHRLYLSEIIELEQPEFSTNNLILAPVGSGKSTLIEEYLLKEEKGTVLMLVSNRFLKNNLCPDNDLLRLTNFENGRSLSMFTTRNKKIHGMKDYTIYVMTYHEFGHKITFNDDFAKKFSKILCDEIHSLPEYKQYNNSDSLAYAIRYLFGKQENQQIFYFTATNENLKQLEKRRSGTMANVTTFDYRNHPQIKKYMELSRRYISHIEEIRPILKERVESFQYFKHKGLAFGKTIEGLKRIETILIEEGFNPLVIWSDANNEYPLSEEQLAARNELIITNKIPEPYNFLVMNSALREGWDLHDPKVKLAIMNTTNETDVIQARGRIRQDIDIVVYRTNDSRKHREILIPDEFLDTPLTTKDKANLVNELNILSTQNKQYKWPAIKKLLLENNYTITEGQKTVDGKRIRVSTITK